MQQCPQQPHGSAGLGEVGQGGWEEDGDPEHSQATAASLCPTAGVNIGGAGSYIYEKPQIEGQTAPGPIEHPVKVEERKVNAAPPKGPSKGEGQGRTGSLALPPWRSAGPEPLRLGMVWGAGCVRGVLRTRVSWLRLSLRFPCPCPLSFQPPASPPSPGSPTCARAVARESTLVRWPAGSGCLPRDGMALWCWGSMQDPWGTQRGWEGLLAQRWGWGHRWMYPRSLQGWVLLEELLGAGLHLHCVPCCHLPGGWHGLDSCPRPASVTCRGVGEMWEAGMHRAVLGFCMQR